MATVDLLPDAEEELEALPMTEEVALRTVMEKLEALGSRLPFPHQSAVRGASVRELRPRSGRSPWRAFTGAQGRRTSWSARSAQRPSSTRGASSGQSGWRNNALLNIRSTEDQHDTGTHDNRQRLAQEAAP
jgi:hypothetical protein